MSRNRKRTAPGLGKNKNLKPTKSGYEESPKSGVETQNESGALPKEVEAFLASLATRVWRMGEKVARDLDDSSGNARSIKRHVAGIVETMKDFEVETRSYTGERYIAGMALHVVSFQRKEGLAEEVIVETLRPSIYFQNRLIQMGEVVVSLPAEGQKDERVGENGKSDI